MTLHAGIDGRWNRLALAPNEQFRLLVLNEVSADEYVETIHRRVRDERRARALLGQPAR